ncbi:hypothetical protein [Massilia eburnea]|uniref:hypothetical protein n=1 Tax=Massilia eburnea TaxID=1776165 RepID=UPI003D6ABB2C
MDITPPPELADHEERITKLENAMVNLSCELKALRAHMDCRFKEIETKIETGLNSLRIELRAEFAAKLHEAVEKLHARMDAQHHQTIALLVAIFLALIALFAQR